MLRAAELLRLTLMATSALAAWGASCAAGAAPTAASDIASLSLEDLMHVEVTTVSRRAQSLQDAAAAVFVIGNEDIRRSGATNIPDLLRMVPGVQVAKVGSNKWAVSARGFAGEFSNKLLVLIDGRSIYSPLFSGVMWEAQDMMLEDIERIEVVRGPGAALWGANAVNGVINIVTKSAKETQGGLVSAGAGNRETGFAGVRYGADAGSGGSYRIYAKSYARDSGNQGADPQLAADVDRSRSARAGFRLDRELGAGDRLSVSGDAYEAHSSDQWIKPVLLPPYSEVDTMSERNRGINLLARLERTLADGSAATFQAYVDSTGLVAAPFVYERRDVVDLDFQHELALGSRQRFIWGLNYRDSRDDVATPDFIKLYPSKETFRLLSAFVHDEIALLPERLKLIAGAKLERNSFTGFEPQPNLRLAWTPNAQRTLWAAWSRAVRTPSRGDRESTIDLGVTPPLTPANPGPLPVLTSSLFRPGVPRESEKLRAIEIGYREQVSPRLSLDVAAFSNEYNSLRSITAGVPALQPGPIPYVLQPMYLDNGVSAHTQGVEVALDWRPRAWWRWQASYSNLSMRTPAYADAGHESVAQLLKGLAPHSQLSLRSMMDLARGHQLDLWLRHVSGVPHGDIPAYTTLDLRYAWWPRQDLELALVGQNLLQSRHAEFALDFATGPVVEVQRGAYVQARWRY